MEISSPSTSTTPRRSGSSMLRTISRHASWTCSNRVLPPWFTSLDSPWARSWQKVATAEL